MFTVNRQFFWITLSTLLMTSLFLIGCGESEDDLLVEEPVVEEPIVEEPVVENNFCSVGDVLQLGESCLDGTGDAFTVLEDGFGQYLFFSAGKSINLFGNINGKVRAFSAKKQADSTWLIRGVTPKE